MIEHLLVSSNGNTMNLNTLEVHKGFYKTDRYDLFTKESDTEISDFNSKLVSNKISNSIEILSRTKKGILAIIPNLNCNGSCSYCYASNTTHDNTGVLSKDKLADVLEKTVGPDYLEHFNEIVVYGGEPLLHVDNLMTLLDGFNVGRITIVTGLLFSDKIFKDAILAIKSSNQLNKITFCLSIDPPPFEDKWENYSRRFNDVTGKSLYDTLIKRSKILFDEFRGEVVFRPTITENCYEWDKLVTDLYTEIGVNKQDIFISVEVEDKSDISDGTVKYLKDSMEKWNDDKFPFHYNIERFIPSFHDGIVENLQNLSGDCDFLLGSITVNRDGHISPCPSVAAGAYLDEIPDTLEEIFKKRTSHLWDKCLECSVVNMCGGFCWITEPSDARCEWRKISIYEGIYQWLNKLDIDEFCKKTIEERGEEDDTGN